MSSSSVTSTSTSTLLLLVFMVCMVAVSNGFDFSKDVNIVWGEGDGHAKVLDGGKTLTLSIDKTAGSGYQSKKEYLFSRFDVELKLPAGNSAGLVTTFYLSSLGTAHDEIDFEFLGNVTGEPVTLHTNIYSQGQGEKEKTYNLWFNPSEDYHLYSVVWNRERIVFYVDNRAIRVHNNLEKEGVPYPTKQPMRLYASIWNGDQWATQGGRIKVDWKDAPYTAVYKNLKITEFKGEDKPEPLKNADRDNILMVEKKHMIYNYCNVLKEKLECKKPQF